MHGMQSRQIFVGSGVSIVTRLLAPFQSGMTSIACAVAFTGLLSGFLTVTHIAATLFGGTRENCPSYGDIYSARVVPEANGVRSC